MPIDFQEDAKIDFVPDETERKEMPPVKVSPSDELTPEGQKRYGGFYTGGPTSPYRREQLEEAKSIIESMVEPPVPPPRFEGKTTLGKVAAGLGNVAGGVYGSVVSPVGLATLPLLGTKAGAPIAKGLFGGLMAKTAGEAAGKASVTGDVQDWTEAAGAAALTGLLAKPGFERPPIPERAAEPIREWQGPIATGEVLRTPRGAKAPTIEPAPVEDFIAPERPAIRTAPEEPNPPLVSKVEGELISVPTVAPTAEVKAKAGVAAPAEQAIAQGKATTEKAQPAGVPARNWELFSDKLAGDLDTFSPARESGRRSYELEDLAQRFTDYAKADTSGKPLDKLVSDFSKVDEATDSQIRKLRTSVKSVLAEEQAAKAKTEPTKAQTGEIPLTDAQFESVRATYWGSKPNPTKIFTHEGKQYAAQSILYTERRNIAKAFQLIPANEWKGETFTQQELYKRWDEGIGERGDDTGLRVKFRGKPYVLANPIEFALEKKPQPTPSPAPTVEARKGGKEPWEMTKEEYEKENRGKPYLKADIFTRGKDLVESAKQAASNLVQRAKSGNPWTPEEVHSVADILGVTIEKEKAYLMGRNTTGEAGAGRVLLRPNQMGKGKIKPESIGTAIHEIGHELLYQKSGSVPWEIEKGKPLVRGEWAEVEKMMRGKDRTQWHKNRRYYSQQTERYARLFELFMMRNAELKEKAPQLYAKIESLISNSFPSIIRMREVYKPHYSTGTPTIELAHRYEVKIAKSEGKPVPAEVLAEYGLKPKEQPPAPPSSETGKVTEKEGAIELTFQQFLDAPREGQLLDALRTLPKEPLSPEKLAAKERYEKASEAIEKAGLSWIYDRTEPRKAQQVDAAIRRLPKNKQKLVNEYEESLTASTHSTPEERLAGQKRLYDRAVNAGIIKEPTKPLTEQPTPPAEAGIGPGAAKVGDVPKEPQIVQLTDEFKRIDGKPIPFPEKVKESFNLAEHKSLAQGAFQRSLDALKATRDYLIKKWDGVKDWDDIKRVKGELSAEINTRGWTLMQFEKQTKKSIPRRRDREAISSWLDTGGDPVKLQEAIDTVSEKLKQSYRDALTLSPELKLAAQHIQSYFEARLQEAIDAGVLEDGITDYIHRIYKRDTPLKQRVLNEVQSGALNTRTPGLAMQRVFKYDAEAEAAGYPVVKDFLPRLVDYEYSLSRVIADRAAVKRFMEIKMPDGRPMIDVAGVGIPVENAEGVTEAMLIKPQFKRGDPNEPGAKTYRKDYKERNDYPAFRRWKWVEKDEATGRDTFVQGDVLVHPDALDRIDALMARSAIRRSKIGSAALGVSSTFKQTMLDFSGFHQVQIAVHGLEHRVMPWKIVKDIDVNDPKTQGLLKGGLNIGGDFHAFDYREGLVGRSLSRMIPGLGELMQSYHEYLFRDYIPRIKTTMALHALERNRQRFPGMSEEQLNYITAKQANAAFGGLNYILMERSKTAQDLSRLILLAPDFLEARGSFAAQAFQRIGKGDKGTILANNEQRQALLLGALTLYVTARIMNKILDDQYHFEPENLFSVVHDGHSYSLRTVQGDLLHLWDKPFQFWLNRLNPVFGRSFLELGTGRDYFGRKRSRMELAWDLFANIRPIAFRNSQERALWESMLNAFGVQAKRWSDTDDAFKLAGKWKEEHGITQPGEFIYDAEKDPLRPLKIALSHENEAESIKQIQKLLESGYKQSRLSDYFKRYSEMPFTGSRANDLKWKKTLSEDQRKTVASAVEHRKSIRKLYFKALGQYNAAKTVKSYAP